MAGLTQHIQAKHPDRNVDINMGMLPDQVGPFLKLKQAILAHQNDTNIVAEQYEILEAQATST